jgi:hypothetical protein
VTPLAPGFAEISVVPHRCGLAHASGKVCTPRGPISVAWRQDAGRFTLEIDAPSETPVRVVLPSGAERTFGGGRFAETIPLP